ncbi:hypothetical protein ACVNF4_32920, partial [Streptomyces sp. S6]
QPDPGSRTEPRAGREEPAGEAPAPVIAVDGLTGALPEQPAVAAREVVEVTAQKRPVHLADGTYRLYYDGLFLAAQITDRHRAKVRS